MAKDTKERILMAALDLFSKKKDTKERILMAALDLFSKKGYEGANIRELSASLGLVKSGIYKHFESKEAIWNALLDRMIAYYGEHFGSAEHP